MSLSMNYAVKVRNLLAFSARDGSVWEAKWGKRFKRIFQQIFQQIFLRWFLFLIDGLKLWGGGFFAA